MDISKDTAPRPTIDEQIRLDVAVHPERTPREHEEAARRIAAESYRAETRRLMDADMLDSVYTGLERF